MIRLILSTVIRILGAMLKRYENLTPEQKATVKKQWSDNIVLERPVNTDR
jgi:hypothetical protein